MTAAPGTIDYVTAVVVLIIAVGVAAGSFAVTKFYATALRKLPRRSGMLLWHVIAVSVAVSGTWVSLALGQLAILGWLETPRVLRLVLYGVFGVLTITALAILGAMQQRRVRSGASEYIVEERHSTTYDPN